MKKHLRILQALLICFVMASGVLAGMKIEQKLVERQEMDLQGLSTAVAVVNLDLGVSISDSIVNYANAVIETLGSDYTVVSASAAQKGLEDGTYGAIITLPVDFSSNIVSINDTDPKQATLGLSINPNLPEELYIPLYTQLFALQQQINNTIAYAYVETVYEQFHAAQDEIAVLFANDETDMEAVKKVSLTNYAEILNLGDMPQVGFEPTSPDFNEFIASAQTIADDMNEVYVSSYADAQEDFAIIKEQIAGYETIISNQSGKWISDMESWAADVSEYARNVADYKLLLDHWQSGAEEYLAEEKQFINGIMSYSDAVKTYLGKQYEGLTTTCSNLQAWRENVLSILNESKADMDMILTDAQILSSNAPAIGNNIAAYNAELAKLNIWLGYLQEFQIYLENPDAVTAPAWPAMPLPQPIALMPIQTDIASVESDMRSRLKNLETSVQSEIAAVPAVAALENAPTFDESAPPFPDSVPSYSISVPAQSAPTQSDELKDALTGIVSVSAGYNPDDYLNEQTKDDAQKNITRYAGYLSGVESSLNSSNAQNLSQLNSIYIDYNTYIGQLRSNVYDVHNREQKILHDSITGLSNTLHNTSVMNHSIMDSFVSRMPNSRVDSTVNQQVVEETVKPITYSYSYIRNEENKKQNESEMYLALIIIVILFVLVIDMILLIKKYSAMKQDEI